VSEGRVQSLDSSGGVVGPGAARRVNQQMARAFAARERDEYAVALLNRRSVSARHLNFADVPDQAGFCRAMLGDMEGALREVGHAVRVNPDYTEAHLNRASELEARPTDELPVEDGNRIALAHAELGNLYTEAGDPSSAIREYSRALDLRPGFADVLGRLARALFQADEADRAVEELALAVERRPSYQEGRFLLGVAYRRLGRMEDAALQWRRCLELNPKDQRAIAMLAALGRGRGLAGVDGEASGAGTGN